MKKSIRAVLFLVSFSLVSLSAKPAGAFFVFDLMGVVNKVINFVTDISQNIKKPMEALAVIDKVKATVGSNWEAVFSGDLSSLSLLGDLGVDVGGLGGELGGIGGDALNFAIGKGFGKIGAKDLLSQGLADVLSSGSGDSSNPESAVEYIVSDSGLFIAEGETFSREKAQEIAKKRKEISQENLNTLYAESLRVKKLIADGEFQKKLEQVSKYEEEGSTAVTADAGGEGGGEAEGDPDLTGVWRANAMSSIVQAEVFLTMLELKNQELRTNLLGEMNHVSARPGEEIGEEAQTVEKTDYTDNVLKNEYGGDVNKYVKDLISGETN